MKKRLNKKSIIITSSIILGILTVFGIVYLLLSITNNTTTTTTNLASQQFLANAIYKELYSDSFGVTHANLADANPVILEAINPGDINSTYETNDGTTVNKFYVPVVEVNGETSEIKLDENGERIIRNVFCIQHGGHVSAKFKSVNEIKELFEEDWKGDTGTVTVMNGWCGKDLVYAISSTFYRCVGDHETALPDLAYILTEPQNDKYVVPDEVTEAVKEQTQRYHEIMGLFQDYLETAESGDSYYDSLFLDHYSSNRSLYRSIRRDYENYVEEWHDDHPHSDSSPMSQERWLREQIHSTRSNYYSTYRNMIAAISNYRSYENYYSYWKYCFLNDRTPNDEDFTYDDYIVSTYFSDDTDLDVDQKAVEQYNEYSNKLDMMINGEDPSEYDPDDTFRDYSSLDELYKDLFIRYYTDNVSYTDDINNSYEEYQAGGGQLDLETWLRQEKLQESSYDVYSEFVDFMNERSTAGTYYSYKKYCIDNNKTALTDFGLPRDDDGTIFGDGTIFNEYTFDQYVAQMFMGSIDASDNASESLYEEWIDEIPENDEANGIVAYLPSYNGGIMYKYRAGDIIDIADIQQITIWLRNGLEKGDGVSDNNLTLTETYLLSEYYENENAATVPFFDMASELQSEADNYALFGSQLDTENEENAMRLENNTDYFELEVSWDNREDPEYAIIGPYNISYVDGTYNGVTYGGIANMWVEGYNADNEFVSSFPIDYFLLGENGEEEITPEYFEPSIDDKRYIDTGNQGYPKPGETFYIKVKNPNENLTDSDRIAFFKIKIEFQWMSAEATICKMQGNHYEISPTECEHETETNEDGSSTTYCHYEFTELKEVTDSEQKAIDTWGSRSLNSLIVDLTAAYDEPEEPEEVPITMELGGKVWEDSVGNKESTVDGIYVETDEDDVERYGTGDKLLPNVKVTLYEYDEEADDGEQYKLADLIAPENEENIDEEDIYHYINPTLTDENGEYLFKGLDATKKYYVVFEYNGQEYMPTEYMTYDTREVDGEIELEHHDNLDEAVDDEDDGYNSDAWEINSKATEAFDDDEIFKDEAEDDTIVSRDSYDERFEEIGSNPKNYISTNSLGIEDYLIRDGRTYYNESFSELDLMGYTLNRDGEYEQTGQQLVDGFEYDEDGLVTDDYSEGIITERIKEYIEDNYEYPDEDAMLDIYEDIVNDSDEDEEVMWRKLQYIEDCKIEAYTGSPYEEGELELYPVYDYFVISEEGRVIGLEWEEPIYPGQYEINLGLWERQEFDLALRKDVYKATLKINDKTVIYNYDKRNTNNEDGSGTNSGSGQDNNTYWDINVRMSDYDSYYGMSYNREIYETDYLFNTSGGIAEDHPGAPLEIYITYKITIRNQSMSILGQVQEVVDYYDDDYTYREDLSWVTYVEGNRNNTVTSNEYYNAMVAENVDLIDNARPVDSSDESIYGDETESDVTRDYNAVYINGLSDKKLATGESAYIYLTFQVNKENERVILDEEDSPKENLAEINGYITYYSNNTELPNDIEKDSGDIAGLLDRDSNPGNLTNRDIRDNDRYEKNFEDDTDRAPSLRVIVDDDAVRQANGTVWEDERDTTVGDSDNSSDTIIGNGIRDDGETGIEGVTVQLVEKCTDGSEYIWYQTTTNQSGRYDFSQYIPGDYVIRFYYGDTEATALAGTNGGANVVSYNGQDFKSTTYQNGITQNETTDISGEYSGYIDTASQNESGTYGYDIYEADNNATNYSDAKDIWSRRQEVINYSDDNITNHIAEVLASPYSGDSSLYNELMNNTYMTAETGVIVVEFEYDRQQTDGLNSTENNSNNSSKNYVLESNRYNGNYSLNNIDLGLVERPKAQLEIDKSVANVEVTLANGTILFDINEAANNAIWQDHDEYSIDEEKINDSDRGINFDDGEIGMYEEYYGDDNRHRYSYRDEIDNLVETTDKGLIQLTMDQELMHGATIQITYTVKITNVGEVDYDDGDSKNFYYKGDTNGASIVTTTANQVVDYVANNLQFDNSNSVNSQDGWTVITDDDLMSTDLVNGRLSEQLAQFNTIITAESFGSEALEPGDEVTRTVVLSQLITPENTSDDLTYENMVEIVKTSNTVGRRMAYSVVGNQDPTGDVAEVDSNVAERIIILPPFGEQRIYYILGAVVALILIGGVILIRRKVLKGKNNKQE